MSELEDSAEAENLLYLLHVDLGPGLTLEQERDWQSITDWVKGEADRIEEACDEYEPYSNLRAKCQGIVEELESELR